LSLSLGEIHQRDSLHLDERLRRKIMIFTFFAAKACFIAEKLVSGISFHCHFTVGRRHPALHPQAGDVIVADSERKRPVSPPDAALCRFHLYAPPGPRGWAK
jgi:hypothetical protein